MPKLSKDFPSTLNFGVETELKQNLIAVGYFMRQGGQYASPARNFIWESYKVWLRTLTAEQRRDFDQILANVKIQVAE